MLILYIITNYTYIFINITVMENTNNKNNKDYPFFPELTDQGKRQAQDLMNKFEKTLKDSAISIISDFSTNFYCDILNDIESDHWSNYRNKILNALCNYSGNKDLLPYDFGRIRKSIYDNHKDEIIKDLNQDLLDEIKRLKDHIEFISGDC